MAELLRQRGLCVGFLGRIDPQIEQRAGVGDLATGLFMRSQLGLEYLEGLLHAGGHQLVVVTRTLLVLLLCALQCLPTLLVFAILAEGRQL